MSFAMPPATSAGALCIRLRDIHYLLARKVRRSPPQYPIKVEKEHRRPLRTTVLKKLRRDTEGLRTVLSAGGTRTIPVTLISFSHIPPDMDVLMNGRDEPRILFNARDPATLKSALNLTDLEASHIAPARHPSSLGCAVNGLPSARRLHCQRSQRCFTSSSVLYSIGHESSDIYFSHPLQFKCRLDD
ncbi:hypothetical protein B0H11DRAFT_495142 [Mycena galericulata]|nr:hypothetical protein B0H11DRAFT_495142 [Mycena galericulata]